MPEFQENQMPDPAMTGGAGSAAAVQTITGVVLVTTPFWADFLTTVNIVAGAIAAVCGAILGVTGVWRLMRRGGRA
jgi:hypothetical protein